ncbi:MAG TPA: nuclear transport factor 2 family protein [Polyangiales bacterium]|nr:nuclear transport factor 2 family protein [Polyangiales bacterium]
MSRVWWALSLALLAACSQAARAPQAPPPASLAPLSALADSRWTWLSAQCVDGGLALDSLGFDRMLSSDVRGDRVLLTYDTLLAEPACESTEVWTLSPVSGGQWWFRPEARVTLPARAQCGAREDAPRQGVLRMSGETLEEIHFGSAWCRGFDVRFAYRRAATTELSPEQLVRRYLAHWNRRDPRAVASLFAEEGQLVEPFTRSPDGSLVRHQGRANVEAWLADAFATTPWLAMQLTEIEQRGEGQVIANWRYMDARLAEPVSGRNLFVLAGGEIFATEVQLLGPPAPRTESVP